jgi:hypothetical protein
LQVRAIVVYDEALREARLEKQAATEAAALLDEEVTPPTHFLELFRHLGKGRKGW